ncbi:MULTISPECIES: nucleotidyl transferase AbiEii/AbiGii toxin family protein [unclassified Blautia]|jgi:predicted nucleotidyltransferase component of viral defense system|uniref:nucleotidyl transferase AbiEii/AbiGii toxin family protein n=1 Tax=unclassified Blautia TaxID=2648079 RepID=UPI001FC8479B|nr:nucleotidyl transferase AbiEii/AbiGii toxin family protein [Blautia sp. MSK.20.85]
MMFLHNDEELFKDVIIAASVDQKRSVAIVEKDYYVTMILKLLAQVEPGCVFKGGTSLSKCHHVIDRFSEDIDITFSNTLTQKVELTLCR